MSVIAIPPSPRPASWGRTRGRATDGTTERTAERTRGRAAQRSTSRASSRPRLRLVTEGFVPEAPLEPGVKDAAQRPASAPASQLQPPAMRRPSTPVALRDRRSELERVAPQHPAVRAARLRDAVRVPAHAPARPEGREEEAERSARPRLGLRLLRGGSLGMIAAIVLVCCGLMVGALVGLTSSGSAAQDDQISVATTTTVVRPGESLWEIAASSGTSDVPGMVNRIVELNDLQDPAVRAGQTLEVPAA